MLLYDEYGMCSVRKGPSAQSIMSSPFPITGTTKHPQEWIFWRFPMFWTPPSPTSSSEWNFKPVLNHCHHRWRRLPRVTGLDYFWNALGPKVSCKSRQYVLEQNLFCYLEKWHSEKNCGAYFWAIFGKNGILFIPTFGHTADDVGKGGICFWHDQLRFFLIVNKEILRWTGFV